MAAPWTEGPRVPGGGVSAAAFLLPVQGPGDREALREHPARYRLQGLCASPADCLQLWYRFLAGIQVSPGIQVSWTLSTGPPQYQQAAAGSLFFNNISLYPLKTLK